jgi:E3 ubiquitin-protein ligase ZNF598
MESHCLICAEEIVIESIQIECNHRDICAECISRLRVLRGDFNCSVCRSKNDLVLIASRKEIDRVLKSLTREDLELIRGGQPHGEVRIHSPSGLLFHKSSWHFQNDLLRKISLACGVDSCSSVFNKLPQLLEHLKTKHSRSICDLCHDNKTSFMSELSRFTASQLQHHCEKGDAAIGFSGHPMCNFCKKRFFGDVELLRHLQLDHFSCHICNKNATKDRVFFNQYDDLESHFRDEHFLCEDSACIRKKFVVFDTVLDFSLHRSSQHGDKRDQLEYLAFNFSSARVGGDSRSRESKAGNIMSLNRETAPAIAEANTLHSIRLSVDDFPSLRAAGYREDGGGSSGAAFPSLPSGDRSSARPSFASLGASSAVSRNSSAYSSHVGAAALNPAEFPSLASTSNVKKVPSNNKLERSFASKISSPEIKSEKLVTNAKTSTSISAPAVASVSGTSVSMTPSTISSLSSAVSCVPGGFDNFKSLSAKFRRGELSSKGFHEATVNLFSLAEELSNEPDRPILVFKEAFPLLIATLPDPQSRNELESIHKQWFLQNGNIKAMKVVSNPDWPSLGGSSHNRSSESHMSSAKTTSIAPWKQMKTPITRSEASLDALISKSMSSTKKR